MRVRRGEIEVLKYLLSKMGSGKKRRVTLEGKRNRTPKSSVDAYNSRANRRTNNKPNKEALGCIYVLVQGSTALVEQESYVYYKTFYIKFK